MKRRLLSILLVLFIGISAKSQDIVYTTKGDSLVGKVTFQDLDGLNQRIKIKTKTSKTSLAITDIKRVVNKKGEIYDVRKKHNRYEIMKLKTAGFLSLYLATDTYINNPEPFTQRVLIKNTGAFLVVPNVGFKNAVANFLEDCNPVSEKIKNKTYGRKNIEEIISEYNQCIGQQYEKQKLVNTVLKEQKSTPEMDSFIELVNKKEVQEKEALLEMLNDLNNKLKKGEKIPGYLKNGITDALQPYPDLLEAFNKAL